MKLKTSPIFIYLIFVCFNALLSCGEEKTSETTITKEPTNAKEVKIGDQIWMKENLNVDHFRNGDAIPEARTAEEWQKAGKNQQPAWCYYENRSVQDDPLNGTKYGKLYNWYAVNDPRGLAPLGWHIPYDDEWTILIDYLGGLNTAGAKMKSKNGWIENGNGTNSSGFEGFPGGTRFDGTFYLIGNQGVWWSSAEFSTDSAMIRFLIYDKDFVGRYHDHKGEGFSVRCLRD